MYRRKTKERRPRSVQNCDRALIKHLRNEIAFLRSELVEQRRNNASITLEIIAHCKKHCEPTHPGLVGGDSPRLQFVAEETPRVTSKRPLEDSIHTDDCTESETFTLVQSDRNRQHRPTVCKTWAPELGNSYSSLPIEEPITDTDERLHSGSGSVGSGNVGSGTMDNSNVTVRRNSKRPQVLTNESHLSNYVPRFIPQRPGTKSYAESVNTGPSTLIVSDSMWKGIRRYEFSSHCKSGRVLIKTQPGEKADVIHAYLRAKLGTEEKRSCVVVHAGSNNLCGINGDLLGQTTEEIVDSIIVMGETCKEFGVNKIIFSGLIVRRNGTRVEGKRRAINSHLKTLCQERGYIFVDNENITINDIENKPRDKVHLLESGSVKLANNILHFLNGKF